MSDTPAKDSAEVPSRGSRSRRTSAVAEVRRSADEFLHTLRESTRMAQELLAQNSQMARRLQALEEELASSKTRILVLERETERLRAQAPAGERPIDFDAAERLSQLAEEQNCLAHLFVASDQLSTVTSPTAALAAVGEILHNMIGASRYALWLRWREDAEPKQIVSSGSSVKDHLELVRRCFEGRSFVYAAEVSAAPVCAPIVLGRRTVGVLLVSQLVPQVGELGRLQRDLLHLLGQRIAPAICTGVAHERIFNQQLWQELEKTLEGVQEVHHV